MSQNDSRTDAMAQVTGLLRTLIEEVRGLRRDLRPKAAPPDATEASAELLQEIFEAVASAPFTSADLLEHAQLPERPLLRDVIVRTVGELNGRKLGRCLAQIERAVGGDLRLVRCGEVRHCAEWRVECEL